MTHNRKNSALAVALLSLGFTVGALAQQTTPATTPSKSQQPSSMSNMTKTTATGGKAASGAAVSSGDRKFVEKAAVDGMAEVELGRVAQSRAQNDQVKQFAQRMVTDHSKANDELKQLAGSKGINVPAAVDKKHQKELDDMQKKDAKKFDHEYMEHMVKEHKKDVSEFEKQAKHAKDPDIQGFASKTLPTLKEHLALAQQVEAAVKGGGGAGRTGTTAGNTGGSASAMGGSPAASKGTTPGK
jgi:putative membrane protein